MGRRRAADLAAMLAIAAAAAIYVYAVFWARAAGGSAISTLDYYGYYYPNWLYAVQAIERGWGLFWNPFQNCGQPFYAIPTTGLFYPLHGVFVLFGPDRGQFVEIFLHLAIGGLGMYWLARELGVGVAGALSGGLAFALSSVTILLASWLPTVIAPFAWMPAGLAAAERLLRGPTLGRALLLAVVLAIQLLPGYPQINFFTYLAIGTRAAVTLAAPGAVRRLPLFGWLAVALVLPIGLAAVQYVPALEFARESLRGGRLSPAEIFPIRQTVTWEKFLDAVSQRTGFGATLMVGTAALAGAALAASGRRAMAWSYAAVLALSLGLSFDNWLFALFYRLPIGGSFRLPFRFLWLAACVMCVLTALGVDAAARAGETGPRRRPLLLLGAIAGAAGFIALAPNRLYPIELPLLAALLACLALARFFPRLRGPAVVALPLLVAANALLLANLPVYGPLRDGSGLQTRRPAFDWLGERMTLQERFYPLGAPSDFSLAYKTAQLFGVRSITDYETQASLRMSKLYVRMFTDRPMRSINDYYFKLIRQPHNRPLFDLLASRYVVGDAHAARFQRVQDIAGLREVARFGDTLVYENPAALPRAFFAPQAVVVAGADEAIARLASPEHDPRRVVLLEQPPADGFLGHPAKRGEGRATITADRGETLSVQVIAPSEGFLALSDQYYPGWEATVNGAPAPVLRANAAFRAVRVPAGESTVEFRYRPLSVRLGAIVSAICWAVVLGYALCRLRRRFRIKDTGSTSDSLDLSPGS